MAQRSTHVQNFFVVRWGAPERADVDHIKDLIPKLEQRLGRPLVYFALIPEAYSNVDDEGRKLYMELTEAVLPHCRRLIIVFQARGFRAAIMRSAMTAVTLLSRRHDVLAVVDSIDTALTKAARELPDRAQVLQAIREVGGDVDAAA